jgi:bacteriorhodopsin
VYWHVSMLRTHPCIIWLVALDALAPAWYARYLKWPLQHPWVLNEMQVVVLYSEPGCTRVPCAMEHACAVPKTDATP